MKKVIWQVELKENKNEIILNCYLAKPIRIRFVQFWTKYIEIIWMIRVLIMEVKEIWARLCLQIISQILKRDIQNRP